MYKMFLFSIFFQVAGFGQNYTSYFTGDTSNITTNPKGGVCLMGGATEDDNAMKWFLQQANGGDILVLRATGSDGYNDYLYTTLGIPVNSVETVVCNNANASNDLYLAERIQRAEAIWFAGGDQWTYITYWRNTPVDSLVNRAIAERNIVIGGTSAGMVIQGQHYFSAENGTVTSATAMANPFGNLVTVDNAPFIENEYLVNVITDTHFDSPDRRGRLATFLARIYADNGTYGKAIACDEYTAVCIDTNGIARVYGGYPAYDEEAYFVQANCDLVVQAPEICSAGLPLTWNLGSQALKVYRVKGTAAGSNSFDLNDWKSVGGNGDWLDWSVNAGVFSEIPSVSIDCVLDLGVEADSFMLPIYPNPSTNKLKIETNGMDLSAAKIIMYNSLGQEISVPVSTASTNFIELNTSGLENGIYCLSVRLGNKIMCRKIVKQ